MKRKVNTKGSPTCGSSKAVKVPRLDIAFLIHKRYIPDPEQLNQQRFKCAAQMREPL